MPGKVLMITYYFPPVVYGPSIRSLNFIKYLTNYGWRSSVLTLHHSIFPALKDFTLSETIKESGAKIYAVNLLKPFSKIASANFPNIKKEIFPTIISSIAKIFGLQERENIWRTRATKLGEKILKSDRHDVIISFVPPLSTAHIGVQLSKKFKIPLVIDYSGTLTQKKTPNSKEQKFLRFASTLLVDNRRIKDHLLQNYLFLDYNSVTIIPTGANFLEFQNYTPNTDDGKFTITFCSGKIGGKKFKLFLSALFNIAKKEQRFKNLLLLNLIGIPTSETLNLISKFSLKENIKIYINIQRENYIKVLLSSDFLIYIDDFDTPNIPYDYIASGKPYIAIINGRNNYRYIIGDYKNSIIADINELSSIVDALEKAFELFTNNRKIIPNINQENYDINKIIINLVRELENLVQ
jgi:hypothetical protein